MKKRNMLFAAAMLMLLSGCQKKEEQNTNKTEETVSITDEKQKEEEKKEEKEKEQEVKLAKNLSDFEFAIDREVYKLPAKIEEWKEKGWEYSANKEEAELDIESYVEGETLLKGEDTLQVDLVNLENEKKPLEDSYVGGITLKYKKGGSVYQLPSGITMGKSVLNEVTAAYGTPTDEYEEKDDIYITYEFGVYKEAVFVFDMEEEILRSVRMKNYREPENESEEISKDEPEAVKTYEAPQGFTENPADYVASYDNQFYKIPAPVSKFIENGWKVEREGSDTYVKAGRHGYVTLEKGGQTLYAVVKNYGEKTVEAENTFVTNISGDFDVIKVPIAIAKEITLGMSEEDMKIQLGGTSYETQEEEDGTSYYLYSDETKKNFIHILIDKDLKLIREIEISNSPESLSDTEKEREGEPPESSVMIDENKLPKEEAEGE